ncbi:MAG TPA: DUF2780 domain-containing protein [Isosphaeraceae bacterium]
MNDLIQSLSSETGHSPDVIRNALGAIFTFLKSHLDPGLVDKIQSNVPGASELPGADEVETSAGKESGLLGTLTKAVGKVLGGGAAGGLDLITHLSKTGLSLASITAILPKIVAYLEAHLPPELFDQIKSHLQLPAEEPTA